MGWVKKSATSRIPPELKIKFSLTRNVQHTSVQCIQSTLCTLYFSSISKVSCVKFMFLLDSTQTEFVYQKSTHRLTDSVSTSWRDFTPQKWVPQKIFLQNLFHCSQWWTFIGQTVQSSKEMEIVNKHFGPGGFRGFEAGHCFH